MKIEAYANPRSLPSGEASRIALMLALEDSNGISDVVLARHVAEGLNPAAEAALGQVLGARLAMGPIVPEPTLRRAKRERIQLSRDHSGRLYELGRLFDALGRAYLGDADGIAAFLSRPHPLLDGDTPLAMARSSSAGCAAVLNLVRQAEAGVAV